MDGPGAEEEPAEGGASAGAGGSVAAGSGLAFGVESSLLDASLSWRVLTFLERESILELSFFFSLINLGILVSNRLLYSERRTYSMKRSSFSSISAHLALSSSSISSLRSRRSWTVSSSFEVS